MSQIKREYYFPGAVRKDFKLEKIKREGYFPDTVTMDFNKKK